MSVLDEIIEANRRFTAADYLKDADSKPSRLPLRYLAIFTCMDTRLVDFLEPAIGVRREDAIVIKTAGNTVTGFFEATIRSLLLGIFEMGVREILVVGHRDCGVGHVKPGELKAKMLARGISADVIKVIENELFPWLSGFHHPETNIMEAVGKIRSNPLIPQDVPVHGLIFDPNSGNIRVVVDGYNEIGRKTPDVVARS